jgi:cell division protein FtsQ
VTVPAEPPTPTEPPGPAEPEPGSEPAGASGQNVDLDDAPPAEQSDADDLEGPRRRARRERAERRAAQQRAMAIEEARREAKRRLSGQPETEAVAPGINSVKGLKTLIWMIVFATTTVSLGLVLYFTPLMSARSVDVVGIAPVETPATGPVEALGANGVTREEVIEVAQVRLGTPLLQIDTDAVADRVAGIRRVASARVQREYPSAVRITIVERVAVVVKDYPDGPHLFDRDGVDFATAPPPPGLPYIEVDNPGPTDPPTRAALEVMTALRPEVSAQVSRIAAPSVASLTLTLADGRTVVWGTTDRTEEKSEKLGALLTQPGRVYDVSSPDLPTVK